MKKSLDMVKKLQNALNSEIGKSISKKLITQAMARGKADEWKQIQQDFVIYLIATTPKLLRVLSDDIYNELRKVQR
jgi:hypothetical protein